MDLTMILAYIGAGTIAWAVLKFIDWIENH